LVFRCGNLSKLHENRPEESKWQLKNEFLHFMSVKNLLYYRSVKKREVTKNEKSLQFLRRTVDASAAGA
jgi:hypothetical protein